MTSLLAPTTNDRRTAARRRRGKPFGHRMRGPTKHLVLLGIVLVFFLPFVVMLTTAFKTPQDIFRVPPALLPDRWVFDNFGDAASAMPFVRYLANSVFLVVMNVAGTLIACPLVAYALAKVRWFGRLPMFFTVLATMMLPPQVTMIPVYLLWNEFGAVNSYWPLIIPQFLGSPFYIFLLRQFFLGTPDELLDAARIDGANEFRIYWQIVLPLAKPALATVGVFQFVATWTDFLIPLIYLNDSSKFTLSIGLYAFFSEHGVQWGPLMAACVMFTLPALVIFLIAQRYFIEGISISGMK